MHIFEFGHLFISTAAAVLAHSVNKKHLWAGLYTEKVKNWLYCFLACAETHEALLGEVGRE